MTTTRNIILSSVASTPTPIYTNASGKTSVLKSINVNGIGDSVSLTTATGADGWLYHGTNMSPIVPTGFSVSSGYGWGVPVVVPLTADRLLLIWTPQFMHTLNQADLPPASILHTQIVEYTGTKYRAGPIVNINTNSFFPVYSSSTPLHTVPSSLGLTAGRPHFKAIALSPTKVVCVARQSSAFQAFRLDIVGNVVSLPASTATYTFFNLTAIYGTSPFAFDISVVPSTTDQVMIFGTNGTSWRAAALSVPDSGSITQLGTTYDTTIAHSTQDGAICQTAKTAAANLAYFTACGATSTTAASIQLFSYNISTFAFTSINTNTFTGATSFRGIVAQCLSSDTTPNAVVVTGTSGASTTMRYYRQTSTTVVSNALNQSTFNGSRSVSTRTIRYSYRWGDSRAVFAGDNCLAVIDSSGTFTDLISNTLDSTSTADYVNLWYNFESRPLYSFYDPGTIVSNRPAHLHARVGMVGATGVGTRTGQGNYFPWGHDYGNHYDWSEAAGCFIVAQHGRMYAIDIDGNVLSEVALDALFPDLTTNTWRYDIRNISVLPSGRILFALVPEILTNPSMSFWVGTNWISTSGTGYAAVTQPILNAGDLHKATAQNWLTLATMGATAHLTSHVDFSGEERGYLLWHNGAATPVTILSQYYGGGWALNTTTSVPNTTAASHNVGQNSRLKLIQSTPASGQYPRGLWRLVGMLGTNTAAQQNALAISGQWDLFTQASSVNTSGGTTLNGGGSTFSTYGITARRSKNIAVVAAYDANTTLLSTTRVWSSAEGRLNNVLGWIGTANTASSQYTSMAVASRAYAIGFNNTIGIANAVSVAYLFDSVDSANARVTIANTSNSGFYSIEQKGDATVALYNAANATNAVVDAVYTITGPNDLAKLTLSITSGSNTFVVANQMISTSNTTFVRINDGYLLANGNIINVSADKPGALSAMFNIVEE